MNTVCILYKLEDLSKDNSKDHTNGYVHSIYSTYDKAKVEWSKDPNNSYIIEHGVK